MTTITLTDDQQNALEKFVQFLTDPADNVFVLEGYSGTGKTTLVKTLLDQLPALMKTAKLINPSIPKYQVELTATTNKAAENFGMITGAQVSTIHSFLHLRVSTDFKTNKTKLIPPRNASIKENLILFIDEASYIDKELLQLIFQMTRHCKIVFMGDPAQLTPVKSSSTPVFDANFTKARLSKVVRQAEGNPIVDLSTRFRETVNTGKFFSFKPDGHHIKYMDRVTFNDAVEQEFCRDTWRYSHSKLLAWTNKTVVDYNHRIRDRMLGDPKFQVGDYAICNKFVMYDRHNIKTDQMVCITGINKAERHGVPGYWMAIDGKYEFFFPESMEAKKALLKEARANDQISILAEVENSWIDLRAAYACTINKSQGSTFDRVFIDLDDISRCNSGDQIARMLYVGVSRAREQVFLTGDLV